ncbi:MAG: Asp-tRNA(Asn)/Glu-tRNA(Gln) amidotransferase subunit GatB [Chloroflexi bacterium]|nr:Asp-tRNA(Asn)/Glu-tRNA(Gln) amidotransferase subunit GatB [Chloroflexota bacterium]
MAEAAAQARVARGAVAWEAVIGIEVHAQLRTASKMFCACSADLRDAGPNTHTCPVCLGMPGVLPVINRRAVELVLSTGMAIDAEIASVTRWDRKNYFYPDLPKGYQISQFDLPLAAHGQLALDTSEGPFTVRIRRAHLEEDTARLQHTADATGRRISLVDFNRSGLPLLEIVTEPDIRTAEQARRYAEELRLLLRTIGASDAEMENGQMRVEANVSIRPAGTHGFGVRSEVKNMNSFRAVERAIAHEIERQAAVLEAGGTLVQETRGWDDVRNETYTMRSKEDSDDYRYFPEPDLPPLRTDPAWLDAIRASMPELPAKRRTRYVSILGLTPYDAGVIVADPAASALFEDALASAAGLPADRRPVPKALANWVTGEYLRLAKQRDDGGHASGAELTRLVSMVGEGRISGTNAKEVFGRHVGSGEPVEAIVSSMGLTQISDSVALSAAIDGVLAANPAAVADCRAGKDQAVRFLVGQVMKATRGQANATMVQRLVRERLEERA